MNEDETKQSKAANTNGNNTIVTIHEMPAVQDLSPTSNIFICKWHRRGRQLTIADSFRAIELHLHRDYDEGTK